MRIHPDTSGYIRIHPETVRGYIVDTSYDANIAKQFCECFERCTSWFLVFVVVFLHLCGPYAFVGLRSCFLRAFCPPLLLRRPGAFRHGEGCAFLAPAGPRSASSVSAWPLSCGATRRRLRGSSTTITKSWRAACPVGWLRAAATDSAVVASEQERREMGVVANDV